MAISCLLQTCNSLTLQELQVSTGTSIKHHNDSVSAATQKETAASIPTYKVTSQLSEAPTQDALALEKHHLKMHNVN